MKTGNHFIRSGYPRIPAHWLVFAFVMVFASQGVVAQVSVNTTGLPPHASSMLDISGTGKGLLIPRMLMEELPLSPATGLIAYVTDFNPGYYYFDGTFWQKFGLSANDYWLANGFDLYFSRGRIAVGTNDPEGHGIYARNYMNGKSAVRGVNGSGPSIFAEGMLGVLNTPGIITMPVYTPNIGVLGIKPNLGDYGAAIYGWNKDSRATNYAGLFVSDGPASTQNYANYGVYGKSRRANINYGGYFLSDFSTQGTNYGIYTIADSAATNYGVAAIGRYGTTNYGLYGYTTNGTTNYSVWSYAGNSTNNYAIYSQAVHGATNYGLYSYTNYGSTNYAGYFTGRVTVFGNSTNDAADYKATVLAAKVMHNQLSDTRAVEGISKPADGWGIGMYGEGGFQGVKGYANAGSYNGDGSGLYGEATGTSTTGIRVGVDALAHGSGKNYGIRATAYSGTENWAGYFTGSGYFSTDLRIGTTTLPSGYALAVNGSVICTEVLVKPYSIWPDYVFSHDYTLMSLPDLEKNISENNHLPGMPSAAEAVSNGVSVGEMQQKLLEKVEELTLHLIRQNKKIESMQAEIDALKAGHE